MTPTESSCPSASWMPSSRRADQVVTALVGAVAGDDAVGGALVLDLGHGALVGLVGAVELLGDQAVEPGALELGEPLRPRRSRSVVAGVRWIGACASASACSSSGAALAERPPGEVVVAQRQQVEGHELRRRLDRQLLHPARRRVDALAEQVEVEAVLARPHHDDLAVDDAPVGQVGQRGLDDLGEVAGHRLLVAAADLDQVAGAEDDRAEAVPLRLEADVLALEGRDALDRLGEHRRHRRHDRHPPALALGGVALGLGRHVLGIGLVGAPLARLHARRLARHLRVVGREVELAQPALVDVALPQGQRAGDVADLGVDVGPRVAAVLEHVGHGEHGEVAGAHRGAARPR